MQIHSNFQDLAVRLIQKNGREITIQRAEVKRDSTEAWKVAAGTPVVTTAKTFGAFLENESSDQFIALMQAIGAPEGARTSVGRRETECFIPAKDLSFEIRAKDTILEVDGSQWEINNVRLIAPGPTKILYICTVVR